MAFADAITQGFGRFGNALFPVDPNSGVDPATQQAAQSRAILSLGLGLMAGGGKGLGLGQSLYGAYQGASQDYTGAMDNAYKHTLIKRQSDYQQQEHDRQAKLQQQQDRQNAASTASRVAAGLQNPQYSANPGAYWDLVKSNPDVQAMLQQSGIQVPQDMSAPSLQQFGTQLGTFGSTSAAPTAPRDLNLKAVMGPNGKPILVPEVQAIGQTPYEKAPEQQLSRFSRPVEGGKVQDFTLDAHTGRETPLGQPYTPGKGSFSDQTSALLASLASKGVSLPTGMRSKEQQAATLNGLLQKFPDKSPDDIADMVAGGQIDFGAAKKETTTAAAQAGRVAIATNELNTFAPIVLEASAKVPRTSFIPINKLMQMGEKSISDPNLLQLKISINSMLNAYDQLAARGGTDAAKREEAHSLLSTAQSPEALAAGVAMFQREAKAAGEAAAQAEKYHPPGSTPATMPGDDAILKKWGG